MLITLLVLYAAYSLLFGFSVLCLGNSFICKTFALILHSGTGLYYLAELIEEYAVLTKKVIRFTIIVLRSDFLRFTVLGRCCYSRPLLILRELTFHARSIWNSCSCLLFNFTERLSLCRANKYSFHFECK
jgi:hypothetical protein